MAHIMETEYKLTDYWPIPVFMFGLAIFLMPLEFMKPENRQYFFSDGEFFLMYLRSLITMPFFWFTTIVGAYGMYFAIKCAKEIQAEHENRDPLGIRDELYRNR